VCSAEEKNRKGKERLMCCGVGSLYELGMFCENSKMFALK
jgi:hypothetical protein